MARASEIIKQAQSWLGRKESDGSHREIIDVYNSHKPYARGYKVKYTDAWCSTFVTAVAIKCNATDIIPKECGCEQQINLFKKMGCWEENEAVTPKAGWIIFYDWQDNGVGDNKGYSDHVGIVEKVENGQITIIEGNCSDMVKRTTYAVNAKFIRGYGIPKYEAEPVAAPAPAPAPKPSPARNWLMKGDKGADVKKMQEGLIFLGYDLGKHGADGDFGNATDSAVRKFQKDYKLVVDGEYGVNSKVALEKAVAEKKAAASKPVTTIKAGTKFSLKNTPVYNSETGATVGNRTGTWYAWEDEKAGQKRIKMTNRLDRVGVKGQVSFFVDVASLK